jgi:hypothetical protein
MVGNAPDPNQPPLFQPPPRLERARRFAQQIGDIVQSAVIGVFWLVVLCASLAGAVVSLLAIRWAALLAIEAVGG